ncbi:MULTISPECIES: hypothetical protein [unclassified Mesorhizobium]|uniref:hypothetical protein n=1 Tax=unclassified Mesorhizobium TaxID=325217 RepID=UPI001125E771|nr:MULTISPECIES: hypothetical protein [unclassified Mesorhizobium]TPK42273.1 hypothetical protein FJ550_30010 [Mesorhizobium sp. B2-5-2]TPL44532.1 hypothetical protein FJ961_04130 [Mesorhizobium sp. B2-4-5]TPM68719.1 hypothetical protein FJ968_29935 [Mesorhizobium sp. B2-1-6]TPN71721.1 hypothetical protein FJ985_30515 [Mesorhizobium sp. B1-1-2]
MNATTYEITLDGTKRTVTLAQFRAEIEARRAAAAPIIAALLAGDIEACAAAQSAMRAKFSVSA